MIRPIRPRPVDQHDQAVAEADQEVDVRQQPEPPRDEPIAGVDAFTEGRKGVRTINSYEVEVKKDDLPKEPEIVVMRYAL